jgi:hypothetical protein
MKSASATNAPGYLARDIETAMAIINVFMENAQFHHVMTKGTAQMAMNVNQENVSHPKKYVAEIEIAQNSRNV